MHLYALWYEDFEREKSRDVSWPKVAAERLSEHFRDFLRGTGARGFTARELVLYQELRSYNAQARAYHNRHVVHKE